VSLALINTLLPCVDLGTQFLIPLFNQFHIKNTTQCLFLSVPLLKHRVNCSKVKFEVTKLKLILAEKLAILCLFRVFFAYGGGFLCLNVVGIKLFAEKQEKVSYLTL
jgi:hypothetical protein